MRAIEQFLEKYPHNLPLTWLDLEINDTFGIDVFSRKFPISKGYEIFKNGCFELLVIRLEDFHRCYKDALRDFMNIKDCELLQANFSKDKKYNDIYQEFKNYIKLPQDYIQRMYTSKYAKHFYSQDEIDKFIAQWSR